jgi:hypothetical protein
MNNEPSYFGLTNDHTWLSVDEEYYKKLKPTHRMKCYTHPAKTLTELEILDVWVSSNFVRYTENGQIDEIFFNKFANAILKKASEK